MGCPLPPYIKEQGREVADLGGGRAKGGVLLPPGGGLLLSLLEKKRGGEGEGKGGCPLVQFGPEGGRRPPSFWPLSSIPVWPNKAHILPGEFP